MQPFWNSQHHSKYIEKCYQDHRKYEVTSFCSIIVNFKIRSRKHKLASLSFVAGISAISFLGREQSDWHHGKIGDVR